MLQKPQIQSLLALNRVIINEVQKEQQQLKRDCGRFFVEATPDNDEMGRVAFESLNKCRDYLRQNKEFLKKFATIQRSLKKLLKS